VLPEKYIISSLKGLALSKFKILVLQYQDTNDFLNAVGEVYTSTIDIDRGLRGVVLEVISAY
jgi:hypothetical protein